MIYTACTLLSVGAVLAHMLRVGGTGGAPERSPDGSTPPLPDRQEMRRHLMWRSFYVNPADPRGWVPKTWGFGWTVNFRTRRNVHAFVALIVCTLANAVGLVASATRCG